MGFDWQSSISVELDPPSATDREFLKTQQQRSFINCTSQLSSFTPHRFQEDQVKHMPILPHQSQQVLQMYKPSLHYALTYSTFLKELYVSQRVQTAVVFEKDDSVCCVLLGN